MIIQDKNNIDTHAGTGAARRKAVGLTLIPPAPVTDQIILDIRVAVYNHESSTRRFSASLFSNEEKAEARFHHEEVTVPGHSAVLVKCRRATKDLLDSHAITAVVSCGEDTWRTSQPLTVVSSDVRSPLRIDGAWVGIRHWNDTEARYWNRDISMMTDDHWRELVRGMHGIGMNIINLQEVFRNEEYVGKHAIEPQGYRGKAFYPSPTYPKRMSIAAYDPLEAIFDEADRLGMHVLPGIGMYAWFDYSPGSLAWHLEIADEIWTRYGHHPSFYGWKISEEGHGSLGSRTWESGPVLDEDRCQLIDFFCGFGEHVRRLAPDKPVMVARSAHGMQGAADTYRELLKHLDILCSFCFHRMPPDDLTGKDAAIMLQELCDEACAHLWLNMEIFLFENDGETGTPLIPRPIDKITRDLFTYKNFEKVLCYQYPGLMTHPEASVKLGGQAAINLYQDYKSFIERRIEGTDKHRSEEL